MPESPKGADVPREIDKIKDEDLIQFYCTMGVFCTVNEIRHYIGRNLYIHYTSKLFFVRVQSKGNLKCRIELKIHKNIVTDSIVEGLNKFPGMVNGLCMYYKPRAPSVNYHPARSRP